MTTPSLSAHPSWTHWHLDEDDFLTHSSGLKYRICAGHGFVHLTVDESSLVIFQARLSSKGMSLNEIVEQVRSVTSAAQRFYADSMMRYPS